LLNVIGCSDSYLYRSQNLTYDTLTTQWILCWCLFIEEFHPTFHYIKGVDDVIADAVSHLSQCNESIIDTNLIQPNLDPGHNAEVFSLEFNNSTLLQCLSYHAVLPDEIIFPLEYSLLHIHQL
jgi:hypothetical protein